MTEGKIKITPWSTDFIDELVECHWSETAEDKIANSSKFHLLDSAQYFVDLRPKNAYVSPNKTFDQTLREADRKRLTTEKGKVIVIHNGIKRSTKRKTWKVG
jgi:hypothetical protein